MSWFEIFLLACVLAVDAFSVGSVVGLSHRGVRQVVRLSFYFGLFQALFPLLGALAGRLVFPWIEAWDHWLVFFVLSALGVRMLIGAFRKGEESQSKVDLTKGVHLIGLSTAVSIDALAAGLLLAATETPLISSVVVIGLVTSVATAVAMLGASRVPRRLSKRAEALGGVVLILLGTRTLLTDLGVLR